MLIGDKIRRRREALELTQQQAAMMAGFKQGNWSRIESSKGHITIKTLCRIALALRCRVRDLID